MTRRPVRAGTQAASLSATLAAAWLLAGCGHSPARPDAGASAGTAAPRHATLSPSVVARAGDAPAAADGSGAADGAAHHVPPHGHDTARGNAASAGRPAGDNTAAAGGDAVAGAASVDDAADVAALAQALRALDPRIDAGEARRAAQTAFAATRELARRYRMVWPPQLHNALVNAGLRERGLCCHWAADLVARLHALDLHTIDVHWVIAHEGSLFREHNSPMLSPRGGGVHNGIVVDGWRHAGRLAWVHAAHDRYPWRVHAHSAQWQTLACKS